MKKRLGDQMIAKAYVMLHGALPGKAPRLIRSRLS